MKAIPTDDRLFGKGMIREDGSVIHPIYLFQVKSPEEIKRRMGLLQAGRDAAGSGGVRSDEQGVSASFAWIGRAAPKPWH